MIAKKIAPARAPQKKEESKFNEIQRFYEFLQKNIATASISASQTGIPQKNITRYKRRLEKANRLWQVKRAYCKLTGYMAWYLSTDPARAPVQSQLNLF